MSKLSSAYNAGTQAQQKQIRFYNKTQVKVNIHNRFEDLKLLCVISFGKKRIHRIKLNSEKQVTKNPG